MSRSRSVSPPESSSNAALGASESPVAAAQSAEGGQCEEQVLFEGYLYKVPPLKKSLLMVKWSKRWFVLKKVIQTDLVSINLCYYKDINKKSVPRMINLSKITGIRPSSKIGSSDHIFAIETEERKYILRAQDHNTKNIWLAKLCELCGQEVVYHVTIPKQNPTPTEYSEAIIRFGTPGLVTFATPSSNSAIFSIPHADVRRLGLNSTYGLSILWFEICQNSKSDKFFFVLVPSSQDTARQILQELKVAIQNGGRPLIKEESGNLETSYIARSHYGCQEFPSDMRYNILQTSLYQISSSSPQVSPLPAFAGRFFPPILPQTLPAEKKRDPLVPSHSQSEIQVSSSSSGVSLEEFGRRKTYSRYPQPASLSRKPTLDKFVRQGSTSSTLERQPSVSSTLERQSSVSSPFERHMSISSMDNSTRTMSFDRSSPPSSLRESDDEESSTDRRCSSSSSSDVFDFQIIANGKSLKRKLSIQSSLSSQNSAQFSSSHSPPIMEEVVTDSFTFEQTSDINVPAVPPRSIISLAEVPPAH